MKLSKIARITLISSAVIWILAGITFFNISGVEAKNGSSLYKNIQLFTDVFYKISQNYVDETSSDSLVYNAIEGLLSDLDPHTIFFTPEEFIKFKTKTNGKFGGLGISIDKIGDYIVVVSPIEGSPAQKAGIRTGDKFSKVDGKDVKGITINESQIIMRGEKGTKVNVSIIRPGVEEELSFDIVRDDIKMKSVPYSFKYDENIGYIKLSRFNRNTTDEFRTALNNLEDQGIASLIIDLRFNPGGLLIEAVNTVNEFLDENELVVSTKGRSEFANQNYLTRFDIDREEYPIVVLINEGSASAAEIFAGTIQDYDKGLILGKRSFGKGSVQTLRSLENGFGIKITTAKYYTKSGRCIHKDSNDDKLKGKKISEEDQKIEAKNNLEEVYYTKNGRKVYGGGGINPDIEILQKELSEIEKDLIKNNCFFNFAVDYVSDDKEILRDFNVDTKIYNKFLEYLNKKEFEFTKEELDKSKEWINDYLRSEILACKYSSKEGFEAKLRNDNQFNEAIGLLRKYDNLEEMFAYSDSLNSNKQEKK